MFDKIVEKAEGCLSIWGDVVFSPQKYFSEHKRKPTVSSFDFFVISLLLSYALMFLVSALIFLLFDRPVFLHKVGPAKDVAVISELFIAYLITFLIGFLIAAAISFSVAVMLGSKAKFIQHLRVFFQLSALEPVAVITTTIMFLSNEKALWLGLGALGFILVRIWGLYSGYWGIQQVHHSSRSSTLVYLIGFLPSWTILTTAIAGFMWLLLSGIIVGWWD